jgi:hypothetical protein
VILITYIRDKSVSTFRLIVLGVTASVIPSLDLTDLCQSIYSNQVNKLSISVTSLGEISPSGRIFGLKNIAQNSPTYISSTFWLLLVIKFTDFDQQFLSAKVLIYVVRIHFGQFMDKIGRFFSQNVWSHCFRRSSFVKGLFTRTMKACRTTLCMRPKF